MAAAINKEFGKFSIKDIIEDTSEKKKTSSDIFFYLSDICPRTKSNGQRTVAGVFLSSEQSPAIRTNSNIIEVKINFLQK